MPDQIILKLLPGERGWRVTRDDRLVAHYPTHHMAQTEIARLGRKEAKLGNTAKAIMHRGDGAVVGERTYAPRLPSAPRAQRSTD